jgi:hypothetical protein
VPLGLLLDAGHPEAVFLLVAGLLALSLLCAGAAEGAAPRRAGARVAPAE